MIILAQSLTDTNLLISVSFLILGILSGSLFTFIIMRMREMEYKLIIAIYGWMCR